MVGAASPGLVPIGWCHALAALVSLPSRSQHLTWPGFRGARQLYSRHSRYLAQRSPLDSPQKNARRERFHGFSGLASLPVNA